MAPVSCSGVPAGSWLERHCGSTCTTTPSGHSQSSPSAVSARIIIVGAGAVLDRESAGVFMLGEPSREGGGEAVGSLGGTAVTVHRVAVPRTGPVRGTSSAKADHLRAVQYLL